MQLTNFNYHKQNEKMYGGTAGRKIGISHEGKDYLLKFPGNIKEKHMKNVNMSYSNSPVCEYIGSKIYEMLGIPVHETILGMRNEKVVVACCDFLKEGEKLYEFDKIKVTFEPHFMDSNGNETNGVGVDLYEILMTIDEHPFLRDLMNVKEHFWDMFIVDAFIGNPDRNNNNWGIIISSDGIKRLAPVYDNGNCLNSKWDDDKMKVVLEDEKMLMAEAYHGRRCIFEKQCKRINPYHLIESMEYSDCNMAVRRLTPIIETNLKNIINMISEIPVLSNIQRTFFINIMEMRYKKILYPVYERTMQKAIMEGRCR